MPDVDLMIQDGLMLHNHKNSDPRYSFKGMTITCQRQYNVNQNNHKPHPVPHNEWRVLQN